MEHAYREDELQGAMIIDSEGYVYGKVEKVNIDEDEIVLLACEDKPDVKTVANMTSLKETLQRGVRTTLGSRLRRIAPEKILSKRIRKEFGLSNNEELSDELYLKYATRMGVSVPYVKAAVERKEQKGTVKLNEIKTIRITVMGRDKETKVTKVILLRKPKEAAFRRIPIQKKAPYRGTDAIKDKLVLDSEGNALGYADSVVLFPGAPGIRVYVSKVSGQVNLRLLTKYLERSGQAHVAALVRKHLMDPEPRRSTVETEELEDFMHLTKVTFMMPEKLIASHRDKEFVAHIPWNFIHKIGDVILLNSTLTDLRSKGCL